MPNVLLSVEKVLVIRTLLNSGLTHQYIADIFGVSRQTITKINTGMKNKDAHSGRWGHVEEFETKIKGTYLPTELEEVLKTLSNEKAGELIKKLLNH